MCYFQKFSVVSVMIAMFAGLSPNVCADPIAIEVTAVASGSLGNSNFNNELITLSGFGDTENVQVNGPVNLILDDFTVNVGVDGLNEAVFIDAIQAVSNNNSQLGGFGNATNDSGLIFIANDAFATYDLTSSLGPVTGTALVNFGTPHATSEGNLIFDSISDSGQFTATVSVIPESNFAAMLLASAPALGLTRRRRRAIT